MGEEKSVPPSYLRTSYRNWLLQETQLSREQPVDVELTPGKLGQKWTLRAEVVYGKTGDVLKGELAQDRDYLFMME